VARVLRPGGRYYLQCANPFSIGVGTRDWNGAGYTLRRPYAAGGAIDYADEEWVYSGSAVERPEIPAPREYRHTLGTITEGLAGRGFVLRHLAEFKDLDPDPGAEPGSWQHLTAFAPPWLAFWWEYRPDMLAQSSDD
jgi:hypothetical protein